MAGHVKSRGVKYLELVGMSWRTKIDLTFYELLLWPAVRYIELVSISTIVINCRYLVHLISGLKMCYVRGE